MAKPLGKLVRKAASQTTRWMDSVARQYGLTGIQMSVIDFIAHQPGYQTSQHAIENEFGIQRSTTTVMLQRMEKRGLIVRQPSSIDRRQREVMLTDRATKLITVAQDFIRQDDQDIRSQFTTEELVSTEKVLNYLIKRGNLNER